MSVEHDPNGWEQRCTLDVIDASGRKTGEICNTPYRVHWIASQRRSKREPHNCRGVAGLRSAIAAQRLEEIIE